MVVVSGTDRLGALEARGIFGLPNGCGQFFLGWSVLGDWTPEAGIYQKRPRATGQIFVKMRHYIQRNPQTTAQMARRAVFADGVEAWHGLDESVKELYRRAKYPEHMNGFCRFMREYLRDNA